MTSHQPRSVTLARWAAAAQTAYLSVLASLCLGFALIAHHSDVVAARVGRADDFAGLGVVVGLVCAVLTGAAMVLVGIPLLLLRRGRPSARITLVVAEAISVLPFAPRVPWVLTGSSPVNIVVALSALWVALAITTIAALCTPTARAWSARPYVLDPMPVAL